MKITITHIFNYLKKKKTKNRTTNYEYLHMYKVASFEEVVIFIFTLAVFSATQNVKSSMPKPKTIWPLLVNLKSLQNNLNID